MKYCGAGVIYSVIQIGISRGLEQQKQLVLTPAQPHARQHERQRRLAESCLAYNDSLRRRSSEFVVSHELKVLYCIAGKVACTSWLRVLLRLTGRPAARSVAERNQTGVHAGFRPYLGVVSVATAAKLSRSATKDYFTFMFAREPLERLVSAYRDKMIRGLPYRGLRRNIIRKYRRQTNK